jgi:hydrogenase nickel incorporation protein HypA/HybF
MSQSTRQYVYDKVLSYNQRRDVIDSENVSYSADVFLWSNFMHELAIVEGLIDLINREHEKHGFSHVHTIQVACGIYNCVSEENLNFNFRIATEGTYLETAKIVIRRLPERWTCSACKGEFIRESKTRDIVCPACNSSLVIPLLNSELYLDNLEVD